MIDQTEFIRCQLNPARIVSAMGFVPYSWQGRVLATEDNFLLNIHRQGGKTATCGFKAAAKALFKPGTLSIAISRTKNQAQEVLRKAMAAYYALGAPVSTRRESMTSVEFDNGSRIISLPAKEASARGFSADTGKTGVDLLLIDEASRVPEEVIAAVEPMASRGGQIGMLSTPRGQRGTFFKYFTTSAGDLPSPWVPGAPAMWKDGSWLKIAVPWTECPDIKPDYIAHLRRTRGDDFVAQEYENSFTRVTGLVYPGLFDPANGCFIDKAPAASGQRVGGIDFGWRDPFAAVWGWHDQDSDILYIIGERKRTFGLLSEHAQWLKKWPCMWVADSHDAQQIAELRAANIQVRKAPFNKDRKAGIEAVNARIRTKRLKIVKKHCPRIVEEAQLYAYDEDMDEKETDAKGEEPVQEFDHLLDALRYLVMHLDRKYVAAIRKDQALAQEAISREYAVFEEKAEVRRKRPWEMDVEERSAWELEQLENPLIWAGDADND